MKTKSLIPVTLLLLGFIAAGASQGMKNEGQHRQLTIIAAPGLQDLASLLAEGYSASNPGAAVKVEKTGAEGAQVAPGSSAIALVREGQIATDYSGRTISPVIGRDVIVGIMNSSNPGAGSLKTRGVSPAAMAELLSGNATWGSLTGTNSQNRAELVISDGISDGSGLAIYAGRGADEPFVLKSVTGKDLVTEVGRNINSIGFCSLYDLTGTAGNKLPEGISLLPLDRNGNGSIDFQEDIYSDLNSLERGVWIGKYPKSLVGNIHAVVQKGTGNVDVTAFMSWLFTDGQKILSAEGHTELLASESVTASDRVNQAVGIMTAAPASGSVFIPLLIFAAVLAAIAAIIFVVRQVLNARKYKTVTPTAISSEPLSTKNIVVPAGVYFDKTHSWAFMDQEGIVTTGIDDFIQHITGTITRIKMKKPGESVRKGEKYLTLIQNGKHLDLYSPVSGIISSVNTRLADDTSALNKSPYRDGWIYRIEPANWLRENPLLFMAEKQKHFINKEFTRLRDFLATALANEPDADMQVVLQDGGEIRDSVLAPLGPEVWEEFQTSFIDPSRQVWFYEVEK